MKKLVIAGVLGLTAITAQAEQTGQFQKVYEVLGMTAEQIEKSFGPAVIDVGQAMISKTQDIMNTTSGQEWKNGLAGGQKTNIRCDIAPSSWLPSVNEWVAGDVVVQAKDGRARITVTINDVHGPGKDTCLSSIEKHIDTRMANLKKLDNNW